ncbi:MAG TPA: AAA family ATPase, partial [Desulfobacterales bacterium]|nr:AAA family ATPase [Desulfobacterales bacterium]
LKEKPFSIAPDPRYLYMSELHREALAHLMYGISGDGCFILLTGDVGTGKTTVCRCLLAQLPENTDVALIVNPRLTVLELLATICDELEIPSDDGEESVKAYIDRLNDYLLDAHARGRNVALLIDEAQNLSLDLLEQLRLLTNLETDQKKLLKIVLLGQTELKQILTQEGAVQISQRITSRYHLLPLDRENSYAYIHHRLAVAGEREKIFSKSALSRIFELSHGIPRLINVLCDRSLLGTYVEEKYMVIPNIVEKAADEVLGDDVTGIIEKPTRKQLWENLLLFILIFFLGAGGASYYFSKQIPSKKGPEQVVKTTQKAPPQIEKEVVAVEAPEKIAEIAAQESKPEEQKEHKVTIRIDPLEISE